MAGDALAAVRAPTLLVVGGDDGVVIKLNRLALSTMGAESELRIVPGATHLFPEPGALEAVINYAESWFSDHLRRREERRNLDDMIAPRPILAPARSKPFAPGNEPKGREFELKFAIDEAGFKAALASPLFGIPAPGPARRRLVVSISIPTPAISVETQ